MTLCSSNSFASPTPRLSSFDDSDQSNIDYSLSIAVEPKTSCKDLVHTGASGFTVTSAIIDSDHAGRAAICVVVGRIKPAIDFTLYLPLPWNGRYYMHGNGGYAGELLDDEMGHLARIKAAELGFAAAFANGGHDAETDKDGTWGYNNHQKEIDFAYRAVHETTLAAKELIQVYYGQNDDLSWLGRFWDQSIRTIEYVNEVRERSGDKTSDFLRLYLVPGMHHCKGGANVDRFDLMTPLINWVEAAETPENLVGKRLEDGKVTRTRPLCAYPQIERYRGSGSINRHQNFECVVPAKPSIGMD